MDRTLGAKCHFRGCQGLLPWVELPAAGDRDVRQRAVFAVDGDFRHSVQDFLTGHDVAECGVFGVEMLARAQGDEESRKPGISHGKRFTLSSLCLDPFIPMGSNDVLTAIGIFATIGHAQ